LDRPDLGQRISAKVTTEVQVPEERREKKERKNAGGLWILLISAIPWFFKISPMVTTVVMARERKMKSASDRHLAGKKKRMSTQKNIHSGDD
jgi:hypothetical protein